MTINFMKDLLNEVKEDEVNCVLEAQAADSAASLTDPMYDYNADQEAQLMNDIAISQQAVEALQALSKAEKEIENVDFSNPVGIVGFETALSYATFGIYAAKEEEPVGKSPEDKKFNLMALIKRAVKAVKAMLMKLNKRFTLWIKNAFDLAKKRQESATAQLDRAQKRKWKSVKDPSKLTFRLDGPSSALTNIANKSVINAAGISNFQTIIESIDFSRTAAVFVKEMSKGIDAKDGSTNVVREMLSKHLGGAKFDASSDVSFIALHPELGLRMVVKGVEGQGKINFSLMYPPSSQNAHLIEIVPGKEDVIVFLQTAYMLFGKTIEIKGNDIEAEANTLLKKAEAENVPVEVLTDLSTEVTNYVALTFGLSKFFTALGLGMLDYGTKSINVATV